MSNDICTTILVQLLYNFLFHTHIMFLFSLFIFLSLLFLTNEKREQQSCLKYQNGCQNITTRFLSQLLQA